MRWGGTACAGGDGAGGAGARGPPWPGERRPLRAGGRWGRRLGATVAVPGASQRGRAAAGAEAAAPGGAGGGRAL